MMLSLTGCAPDYIRPEIGHESHITQHQPFTEHPNTYGTTYAGVTLQWNVDRVQIELSDSLALGPRTGNTYGEIAGPREEFGARIGWNFAVKK
jgi:hypothetical protein